ncbi:MAG: hypothetical protein LBH51_06130, partial [Treponema sp.]|nr:hypothetical protein [Treponema sp.]
MMILADALRPSPDRTWDYALQTGITHAVVGVPRNQPGETPNNRFDLTSYSDWKALYDLYDGRGLRPVVVEGAPEPAHE